MKKKFILFLLLLMSSRAFSQPVSYIKGSFRASNTFDKIYFLPTENQTFTPQETYLADNWLKQKLSETKYAYNNLTINLDFIGNVRQAVKGCFYSWFKKLDVTTKIHLMEHLKPEGLFSFNSDEINSISDALNKYTIDNLNTCQNETILGDLTTTYISIALDQYLSDKSNNRPFDEKYNAILEKSYNQQYKNYAHSEIKNFQNLIESLQNNVPSVPTEVISEFINIIQNLKLQDLNETESSFVFINALNNKTPNLKDYLNEYPKMAPFIKSAKLLFDKCFDHGKFLPEKCSSDNIGNNFAIIQLKRKTKILNQLIWTGQ